MEGLGSMLGKFISVILLLLLALILPVVIGYFAGMVIAILPFIPGLLGVEDPSVIPKITAWLGLVSIFVRGSAVVKRGESDGS